MARAQRLKWAVVGVGLAGRARAKAIAADPRATLAAVWRGRFAGEVGAPLATSFDDAIARADAVAIASPTEHHAAQTRAVLEAGKHAVVEFPLAPDASTAEGLFALARAQGLVLHEEHIELLDAATATLSAHVRPEMVRSVKVGFEGPGPEGVPGGALALANVARLHRVAAFAGPIASVTAVDHAPGQLIAQLVLASGAALTATFRQGPYYARRTTLDIDTVSARWTQEDDQLSRDGMPVTLVGLGGLFSRDQRTATARILDAGPPYVSEGRCLHVMDAVDALARRTIGALPQRSDAAPDADAGEPAG